MEYVQNIATAGYLEFIIYFIRITYRFYTFFYARILDQLLAKNNSTDMA